MNLTIALSNEVRARLDAEASLRGISLDQLITDLADTLPTAAVDDPLEAFIGCGSSGRTEPVDIRDERIRVARAKTTRRNLGHRVRRRQAMRHLDRRLATGS